MNVATLALLEALPAPVPGPAEEMNEFTDVRLLRRLREIGDQISQMRGEIHKGNDSTTKKITTALDDLQKSAGNALERIETTVRDVRSGADHAMTTLAGSVDGVSKAIKDYGDLEKKYNDATAKNSDLERENGGLQQENANLKQQNSDLSADIEDRHRTIEELRRELHYRTSEVKDIEKRYDDAKAENVRLAIESEERHLKNEELRRELRGKTKEVDAVLQLDMVESEAIRKLDHDLTQARQVSAGFTKAVEALLVNSPSVVISSLGATPEVKITAPNTDADGSVVLSQSRGGQIILDLFNAILGAVDSQETLLFP